jgi:hypothetical protein
MKKTFIFVCLALAFPLLAWAGKWEPTDQALYEKFKADATVSPTYDMAFKELGPPNEQNADKWRGVMSAYMMSTNKVDPKKVQAGLDAVTKKCGNDEIFDKDTNSCKKTAVSGKPGGKADGKADGKEGIDPCKSMKGEQKAKCEELLRQGKAKGNLTADDKNAKPTPPPQGEQEAVPEKKDDPNKWNSTIAGGKMAIWAGFIGLILAGPMGMMLAACVGFGAGYFIKEMS